MIGTNGPGISCGSVCTYSPATWRFAISAPIVHSQPPPQSPTYPQSAIVIHRRPPVIHIFPINLLFLLPPFLVVKVEGIDKVAKEREAFLVRLGFRLFGSRL